MKTKNPPPEVALTWKRDKHITFRLPSRLLDRLETELKAYNRQHGAEMTMNDYIVLKLNQ